MQHPASGHDDAKSAVTLREMRRNRKVHLAQFFDVIGFADDNCRADQIGNVDGYGCFVAETVRQHTEFRHGYLTKYNATTRDVFDGETVTRCAGVPVHQG